MEGLLPGAVTVWDTPRALAPPRGSHPDHRETKELLAGLDRNVSLWFGGGREGEVSWGLGRAPHRKYLQNVARGSRAPPVGLLLGHLLTSSRNKTEKKPNKEATRLEEKQKWEPAGLTPPGRGLRPQDRLAWRCCRRRLCWSDGPAAPGYVAAPGSAASLGPRWGLPGEAGEGKGGGWGWKGGG